MTVSLALSDRIRIRTDAVERHVLMKLKAEFEHANPQFILKQRIGKGWWDEEKVITTWRETPDGVFSLPRGGLQRVRNVLYAEGLDWVVDDQRTEGSGPRGEIPRHVPPNNGTLWMHQADLLAAGVRGQNCILRSATGTGKTTTLLAMASIINLPTIVVVPTSGLFKQWRETVREQLPGIDRDCGFIADGRMDLAPLTVALQASLAAIRKRPDEWAEITDYFGVLLADEVQYAPAKTFFDAFDDFPAKYRIGMSDSEKRKDRMEFLAYDLFGPSVYEYTRKQALADDVIVDVEVRVIPTSFRAEWYGIRDKDDETDERKIDFTRLCKEMALDEDRTQLLLDAIIEEARAGSICVVLTHHVDLVMQFAQMVAAAGLRTGVLLGGAENSNEFDRTKSALKDGSIQVAVGTYKATGTGIDIPRVDVIGCLTPIAANAQQVNQVRGRACRRGKATARMIYLWDQHVYPRHLSNLRIWCPGALIKEGSAWAPVKRRR